MYATSQLARAMSKTAKVHQGVAKHVLCYLAGTTDISIATRKEASMSQPSRTPTGATTETTASRLRVTS